MDGGRTGRPGANEQRLTVREAAKALGITAEAVRMRVKRGTLPSQRESGRVYVLLGRRPTTRPTTEQPRATSTDELVGELRDRVRFLERELERKDAILLNMTEAMKAISPPAPEEAPTEAPQAPTGATEQPGRVEPQAPIEGSQEPSEALGVPSSGTARGSWWRRMFGG